MMNLFGVGVGRVFLFLSLGPSFYLRLLPTLGTPATDTVKHHSLLLGKRPNENRAGPRPLDARGQAPHLEHGPTHFSGRRITLQLGPISLP